MKTVERQLHELENQIKAIPDYTARRDLTTMLSGCRKTYSELSKESVACRQSGRETRRYAELAQNYTDQIDSLEGFIIQATLTYL